VHQGSRRRTTANAPAKIYDLDSHYAALAFGLTEMSKLPTDDEVKDAWRRRMREVHPDVPGGSTDKASRVNQAFAILQSRPWLTILTAPLSAPLTATDANRRAYQRKGLVLSGVGGVYR
jgi:hypothetical protein